MRTAKKIRYRLEWLALKFATKFLPLLSRKPCYRLALLLGSLGASLDRRGRRVVLSNLRVPFTDEIPTQRRANGAADYVESQVLQLFQAPRNLGKPGRLLRNLKARPRLWLRYGLRTMSRFVLGFGVCVRLLLSAFH
jgi:hypothetical protein